MVNVRTAHKTGLAVTWLHYRGPGRVTFSPMATSLPLVDGRSTTSVRFSEPGTYVIRAAADDGGYVSTDDVTVVVTPAPDAGLHRDGSGARRGITAPGRQCR